MHVPEEVIEKILDATVRAPEWHEDPLVQRKIIESDVKNILQDAFDDYGLEERD